MREEISVVTVILFRDATEIIESAHNTNYGLASAIWTRDFSTAHRVAAKLRAGKAWINCYNVFDSALRFGGYKQSGWGREMGHQALELYTETKAVCAQISVASAFNGGNGNSAKRLSARGSSRPLRVF